jgi:hypothetical protein
MEARELRPRLDMLAERSAVLVAFLVTVIQAAGQTQPSGACQPAGELTRLAGVSEASGLALSRSVPGRLWTHNDSGQPVLFALDERGRVTGQLRIAGATAEDWEAVASARCQTGTCLYIGDIGDNDAKRNHVTVYRVAEPEANATTSAQAEAFHATYPDGPRDAETLLIAPDGRIHIVTKGNTGLYRFPADLRAGSTMRLERVGDAEGRTTDGDARVTDGAISPDGRWAVLRSQKTLRFFRTSDLLEGRWRHAFQVDLTPLKEPQGEGVAIDRNNTVFVAGESGGKGNGGTFTHFSCVPREEHAR